MLLRDATNRKEHDRPDSTRRAGDNALDGRRMNDRRPAALRFKHPLGAGEWVGLGVLVAVDVALWAGIGYLIVNVIL